MSWKVLRVFNVVRNIVQVQWMHNWYLQATTSRPNISFAFLDYGFNRCIQWLLKNIQTDINNIWEKTKASVMDELVKTKPLFDTITGLCLYMCTVWSLLSSQVGSSTRPDLAIWLDKGVMLKHMKFSRVCVIIMHLLIAAVFLTKYNL